MGSDNQRRRVDKRVFQNGQSSRNIMFSSSFITETGSLLWVLVSLGGEQTRKSGNILNQIHYKCFAYCIVCISLLYCVFKLVMGSDKKRRRVKKKVSTILKVTSRNMFWSYYFFLYLSCFQRGKENKIVWK